MTNEEYVEQRDALIPKAERHADEQAGDAPDRPPRGAPAAAMKRHEREMNEWGKRWSRLFHAEMNRLAKEIG